MTKHFRTQKHDVWLPYRFSVGPIFERFYEGLKEEKILGNKCPKCEKVLVPARTFCPECSVDMEEWVELSQDGEIVTWALSNYEFFGMPSSPPFIGALIKLDGSACNFLHLIGGFDLTNQDMLRSKVRSGAKVRAVWSEEKRGHMLDIKYFEPI